MIPIRAGPPKASGRLTPPEARALLESSAPSGPRSLGPRASFSPVFRRLTYALLYHPETGEQATPADVGLAFERVGLTAADGVSLSAWWIPAPGSRRALLFLHGNAGNLSSRVERLRALHDAGLAVLALDYRGYGRSSGRPTPEGTALDARAAWDHLVGPRGLAPGEIALFGSSLGAAVALELAASVPAPAAVLLEAPFLSLRAMARDLHPLVPRFLVPKSYDNAARAPGVRAPVTLWHGTEDEVVAIDQARRLARTPGWQARLIELPGAGHACIDSPERYAQLARAAAGR